MREHLSLDLRYLTECEYLQLLSDFVFLKKIDSTNFSEVIKIEFELPAFFNLFQPTKMLRLLTLQKLREIQYV